MFAVKKGCYDNAYAHLKSALRYYRKKEEVYLRYADPGAVRRLAAAHALRRELVPRGGGEGARKRFCAAVTADGVVRRDEFLAGRRVHLLKGGAPGVRMFARCFFELVGADILLLDPLTGEEIEGVVAGEDAYVAHAGAFGSGAEIIDLTPLEGDAAGMCAFYDGREREEVARAVSALSAAREAHLAAEKFFVAAADFSVTRRIGDSLAASLFGGENM